jgi:hypothetical protein
VEVSSEAANGGIRGTVFDGLASLTGSTEPPATKRNSAFSTAILLQDAILQLKDGSSSSPIGKAVSTRQGTIHRTFRTPNSDHLTNFYSFYGTVNASAVTPSAFKYANWNDFKGFANCL